LRHCKRYEIFLFCVILLIFLIFTSSSICFSSYPGTESEVVSAVAKVEPSVVNIKTLQRSGVTGRVSEGTGSGIIISRNGWIITNAHVTRNAGKIFVSLSDGRTLEVQEWRANSIEDIAVLKVQGNNLPVALMGNSDNLKKGQLAVAIGNPWKLASTVTVGCISATGRQLQIGGIKMNNMIQTDAAINPGNSGGALVNSKGEVIGVNTLIHIGDGSNYVQGLGFAIPINHALAVARNLINLKEQGSVKPWMGVTVQNVTPDLRLSADYGAIIIGFPPDSPTQAAGLRVGDIIIAINNSPINNTDDLQNTLFKLQAGEEITLIIKRGDKTYRSRVRLEGMRQ
jgi:S1-C subfamily serine protease